MKAQDKGDEEKLLPRTCDEARRADKEYRSSLLDEHVKTDNDSQEDNDDEQHGRRTRAQR